MNKEYLVKKSKHLSKILRHSPESAGIKLDEAGWTDVAGLLSAVNLTIEDLKCVVENNDKKRFEFNEDETKIRARQGHSVDVDLGYEAKTPPDVLYHGTVEKFLSSILADGLKKMNRHHVHLSSDILTAQKVGSRRGVPVILRIDTKTMHEAGMVFYISNNGVWLTDNVPYKYITIERG